MWPFADFAKAIVGIEFAWGLSYIWGHLSDDLKAAFARVFELSSPDSNESVEPRDIIPLPTRFPGSPLPFRLAIFGKIRTWIESTFDGLTPEELDELRVTMAKFNELWPWGQRHKWVTRRGLTGEQKDSFLASRTGLE